MKNVCSWAHAGAVIVVVIFLVGCQKGGLQNLPTPSSEAVEETSAYPAVVKVIAPGGRGLCTGTFISSRAVLTAAHCVTANGTYTVVTSFGTFSTSDKQSYGPGVLDDPNDIAVLYFSKDVADESKGQIAEVGTSVSEGEEVRLIGYGCNNLNTRTGSGKKRTGTNVVYQVGEYIQLVTPATTSSSDARGVLGPINRAGSCFGDSGGFLGRVNSEGKLTVLGVTHAGGSDDENIFSEFANMTRSDNRQFMNDVNSAYSLGISL